MTPKALPFREFLVLTAIVLVASVAPARGALPLGADNVVPLKVGDTAPAVSVKTLDGADFDLGAAFASKPTVLIFYRGGWCPFCNKQLSGIQDSEAKFLALGYQILAVCTDKPEQLKATLEKDKISYTLLSDRSMAASTAFKVAYQMTPEDDKKYISHHIGVPEIAGQADAHWLPVPSIFIIGKDGVIKYEEHNADYKVRPPTDEILAAAAQVKG
jgi:peroxiredoxin